MASPGRILHRRIATNALIIAVSIVLIQCLIGLCRDLVPKHPSPEPHQRGRIDIVSAASQTWDSQPRAVPSYISPDDPFSNLYHENLKFEA